MQCNQPFCTGFQNNVQFPAYLTQPYYQDIIGEGDVMTYTLPDGSVQCYFVPINRQERWIPHFGNSYFIPNNKEVWFVRSILNTYPASGLDQHPNSCGETFLRSNYHVNSPSYGFVQKFHNDGGTSTTDLHYFFPALRHDWGKGCAGIQVEVPNAEKTIFHYGTICNRPCYCNNKTENGKTGNRVDSDCTETPMAVDEVKSSHSCCDTRKKEKNRSKNKYHSCACPRVDTADKVVTTYADQAISCSDMREYSQCGKCRHLERTDIETDMWYPRRRKSKKNNVRCTCDSVSSDSACCHGSACSDT